jgi:hypothetical protein
MARACGPAVPYRQSATTPGVDRRVACASPLCPGPATTPPRARSPSCATPAGRGPARCPRRAPASPGPSVHPDPLRGAAGRRGGRGKRAPQVRRREAGEPEVAVGGAGPPGFLKRRLNAGALQERALDGNGATGRYGESLTIFEISS